MDQAALCCDLGLMAYAEAYRLQVELVERRRQGLLDRDVFLALEHPPVFTLGRRGVRAHLFRDEAFLRRHGIDLMQIERGGEITFHGPGQLVVYAILDLRRAGLSVSGHVERLEAVMLALAADFGVQAGRDERNRGVWVRGTQARQRRHRHPPRHQLPRPGPEYQYRPDSLCLDQPLWPFRRAHDHACPGTRRALRHGGGQGPTDGSPGRGVRPTDSFRGRGRAAARLTTSPLRHDHPKTHRQTDLAAAQAAHRPRVRAHPPPDPRPPPGHGLPEGHVPQPVRVLCPGRGHLHAAGRTLHQELPLLRRGPRPARAAGSRGTRAGGRGGADAWPALQRPHLGDPR